VDVEQYRKLIEAAVIDKVELIDGRLVMGEYDLVFGPEQAVMDDPESLAELRLRLDHDGLNG
jgi:hypothetical protein